MYKRQVSARRGGGNNRTFAFSGRILVPAAVSIELPRFAVLASVHRTATISSFDPQKKVRIELQTVAVLWTLFKTAIYGCCAQVITLIDKKTRKIQLPPTKFFPDGFEDKTYLIIDQPDGSKGKLWLWTELKNKKLVLVYNLVRYVTSLQDDHIITIKEGRIVDMEETEDLMLTEFTNNGNHYY